MLSLPGRTRVFVAREPADMRKGFDGLSALVCHVIEEDPQSGHLFFFVNRRRDRAKILWWDSQGYWLMYRRLEKGRIKVFDQADGSSGGFEIEPADLLLLLEGIDLRMAKRRPHYEPRVARDSA